MRVRWAAVAVMAVAVAGCAAAPTPVSGAPVPLSAPPTPSRPAPVPTPSGTAVPPAAYTPYTLARAGVSITLPVPADWSLTGKPNGTDFGDPSGRVLLRLEIRERAGAARDVTAARGWELVEPELSRGLANYRRLGIAEVPGIGDSAADWTFTFYRGVPRQVVDRGIFVGTATVAIYFSAERTLYESMLPVFDRAAGGLTISRG